MAIITFHGAAQEVTGSCFELESSGTGRLLLDCGMHQGGDVVERIGNETFNFDPASIDNVILSHAHLDHSGLLPKLYREGFRGAVLCTRGWGQRQAGEQGRETDDETSHEHLRLGRSAWMDDALGPGGP